MIDRPRLWALPWRRMFLAAAPAGYGKTILLGQLWSSIAAKQAVKVRLSLGPAHRDFNVFLRSLSAALEAQSFSPQEWRGQPEEMAARLTDAVGAVSQPFYLMLDDYHTGAGPELDAFIRVLASGGGEGVHLAIATRSRAKIGTAILAARGDLTSVDASALAFSVQEAVQFLEGKVPAEDAIALHAQTEGWPAALQLASQAACAQSGRGPNWTLSATSGDIGALVAEETFDPLPEPLRTMLIETAHLNTLYPENVDQVRGRGDSTGLLADIEGSLTLVFPDRDRPDHLRRHSLLRRFLETRFALLEDSRRNELVERTMACLVRAGEIGSALRLARQSAPGSSSLTLLEAAPAASAWTAEAVLDLPGDLSEMSEDRFTDAPRARRLRGLSLYARGRMADARAAIRAGLAQAEAGGDEGVGGHIGDTSSDRHVWKGLYASIFDETISDQALGDLTQVVRETVGRASHTLPAHIASVLALRAGRSGEAYAMARRIGANANEQALADDIGNLQCAATAIFDASPQRAGAALALMRGRKHPNLEAAHRLCATWLAEESGAAWSEADLPSRDAPPLLLGLSPELFVERARLAAAGMQQAGDSDAASAVLHVARATALAGGWRRAEVALDAEMLNLWARAGRRDASARALAEIVARHAKTGRPEAILARARFDVSIGAYRRARTGLQPLLSAPGVSRRCFVEGLIMDARAALALKQADEAEAALEKFLAVSNEGVMARRFHDHGTDLWEPLMALASRIATADASNTCLDIVADLAVTRTVCKGTEALTPPTTQERSMFAALRRTGSRGGAALDLAMSENTLKYYLKRVFEKWDVRDWRLAMRIAERLPDPAFDAGA